MPALEAVKEELTAAVPSYSHRRRTNRLSFDHFDSPRIHPVTMAEAEDQSASFLADLTDMVFASDSCGRLLTAAVSHKKHQLVDMLLQRFVVQHAAASDTTDVYTELRGAALLAADTGDAQSLRMLMDACSSATPSVEPLLSVRDVYGFTPLMLAARGGFVECTRLLLQHSPGTQVAALAEPRAGAWNALMHAAGSGHTACMELLLAHSPELQAAAVGEDGSTALLCAASEASLAGVKLLLAYNPPKNALDDALTSCCEFHAGAEEADKAAKYEAFKACSELLLSRGAMLTSYAADEHADLLRPINRALAARALVPGAVNDSVVRLALAAQKKRKAEEQPAPVG